MGGRVHNNGADDETTGSAVRTAFGVGSDGVNASERDGEICKSERGRLEDICVRPRCRDQIRVRKKINNADS